MYHLFCILFFFLAIASSAQPARYDVIIDEIMPDPSPQVGLPNSEYIELKNVSANSVNLSGWKIQYGQSIFPLTGNVMLQPDSFMTICSNSAAPAFSLQGTTHGVSNFPSLNNESGTVILLSPEGKIIHAVRYHISWYQNALKATGGWSLEMVDTHYPCSGASNWKASKDNSGGTPGRKNSMDTLNEDRSPPFVVNSYMRSNAEIILRLSEPIDSSYAGALSYVLDPANALKASVMPPLFDQLTLKSSMVFSEQTLYTLQLPALKDCSGNLSTATTCKVGLPSLPRHSDIIVNEILFNPQPGNTDYVELYNNSHSIIDLASLYISTRSVSGNINPPLSLAEEPYLIYPADYSLLTADSSITRQYYPASVTPFQVNSLPSLPDTKGNLVLLNKMGEIVDELAYTEDWHFPLLANHEGVALERISFNQSSSNPDNWHSAAGSVGYGTPGYRNSQYYPASPGPENISLSQNAFSPDNNGVDDMLLIHYRFPEPGYVMNITAFDLAGRPVRLICRNALCGINGYFRWDGLDDESRLLNRGIYILLIEYFNLAGKKGRTRKSVTLARKF